jgi:hypothetical protein
MNIGIKKFIFKIVCNQGAVHKGRRQLGARGSHIKSRLEWTHKGVGV